MSEVELGSCANALIRTNSCGTIVLCRSPLASFTLPQMVLTILKVASDNLVVDPSRSDAFHFGKLDVETFIVSRHRWSSAVVHSMGIFSKTLMRLKRPA